MSTACLYGCLPLFCWTQSCQAVAQVFGLINFYHYFLAGVTSLLIWYTPGIVQYLAYSGLCKIHVWVWLQKKKRYPSFLGTWTIKVLFHWTYEEMPLVSTMCNAKLNQSNVYFSRKHQSPGSAEPPISQWQHLLSWTISIAIPSWRPAQCPLCTCFGILLP